MTNLLIGLAYIALSLIFLRGIYFLFVGYGYKTIEYVGRGWNYIGNILALLLFVLLITEKISVEKTLLLSVIALIIIVLIKVILSILFFNEE